MNDIYRCTYTLEFDAWDPQKKIVDAEMYKLIFDLKNKLILAHAGNVKITPLVEERIRTR